MTIRANNVSINYNNVEYIEKDLIRGWISFNMVSGKRHGLYFGSKCEQAYDFIVEKAGSAEPCNYCDVRFFEGDV